MGWDILEISLILLIIMFVLVTYESFYTGVKKLRSKGIYEESGGLAFLVSVMTMIYLVLDYKSKISNKETGFTENSWILAISIIFFVVLFYRFWTRKDYTVYGITKEKLSEIVHEILIKYDLEVEELKKESEIEIKIKNDKSKVRIIKDDVGQTVYLNFINYRQIQHIYIIFDNITDLVHKLTDEKKSYNGIGDIILGLATLVFFIFLFYKFQII